MDTVTFTAIWSAGVAVRLNALPVFKWLGPALSIMSTDQVYAAHVHDFVMIAVTRFNQTQQYSHALDHSIPASGSMLWYCTTLLFSNQDTLLLWLLMRTYTMQMLAGSVGILCFQKCR